MYNGDFKHNRPCPLYCRPRTRGPSTLTWYQVRYSFDSDDRFTVAIEQSADGGEHVDKSFPNTPILADHHTDDFMKPADGYGSPSPDRPEESSQFDFLIGEWNATQKIFVKRAVDSIS